MNIAKKLEFIVKQNEQGRLSHAFLIETNNIEACFNDVITITKYINCENKYKEDCKICNICNLIDKESLPSLMIIKPDGAYIKRDQIDELQQRFAMKPVFSKYNIYVIVNAETMNSTSFNLLLKFLEEPNENTIGILITKDIRQIIPTIASRCERVSVNYDNEDIYSDIKDIAEDYLDKIINTKSNLVNKELIEKNLDRNKLYNMFLYIHEIYKKKLEENINNKGNNNDIIGIINLIEEVLNYINSNVNTELLLDKFCIEMRRFS